MRTFTSGVVFAALGFFFCANAAAQETFMEPSSMKTFPKQVRFEYEGKTYALKATGAAEQKQTRGERTRRQFTLAHYMETPPASDALNPAAEIEKDKGAKQFTLNFSEGFSLERFVRRLERDRQNYPNAKAAAKLEKSLAEFVACLGNAPRPDEQCFVRWLPDGKTQVVFFGQEPKLIVDPAFAPFFWRVWFGDDSSVSAYDLVSLLTSF